MTSGSLYRLSAFTTTPAGGNPAGVWIGDTLPAPEEMQQIAAEVGYSETAFVAPCQGARRSVRYYSPEVEVPFCGHATIAAGAQLGQLDGPGDYLFETRAGDVTVAVRYEDGLFAATLTSVEPKHRPAPPDLLERALAAVHWKPEELDPSIPSALAFAGAWHLVIAAGSAERLAKLDYDFPVLKALMIEADLITLQLVWRESPAVFQARNPFPVGGVVEDPATGAAAAALGGYLRDAGLIEAPATVLVRQGEAMGRPSRLTVRIPTAGGIGVSGHAVAISP
jgi:PhzF family phenazine biosynthesis protein